MEVARRGPSLPLPSSAHLCLAWLLLSQNQQNRVVTETPGCHQAWGPLLGDQCALDLLSEDARF